MVNSMSAIKQAAYPARYWQLQADGRIRCELCPRFCKLKDGQRGMCFVRQRQGDHVVLTTYGRSSGFCIDPVEKKPLNHFLPGSPTLSFGTAGCNLACKFCQNWDISKSREWDTLCDQASPAAIAATAERMHCRSVAFTYNDPVIFCEYAIDVAEACHRRGIRAVAVSAGYMCAAPRAEFYASMDAANIDLKGFSEDFYWKVTGSHLDAILDTILYIHHETEVWMELTTLLIPGLNDSTQEIEAMTGWVVQHLGPEVPMHFTAFHPDWKMRDRPPTPTATLARARAIALKNGVQYAYTGNVHDVAGGSTYCASCAHKVIDRDWYVIRAYHLTDGGQCRFCGAQCAGVFDGPCGDWGAKRQPVQIAL
jgi:pyruvate formate lyase activating enzyme